MIEKLRELLRSKAGIGVGAVVVLIGVIAAYMSLRGVLTSEESALSADRVFIDSKTGKPYGSLTIVDCQGERRWARPVDCAEAPDGTIVFSCDEPQAALYRISRSSMAPPATLP